MTFVNNHGSAIADEDFEAWAKEAEKGDFSNWEPVGEPVYEGYLETDPADASTMTFVCPMELKLKIGDEAKRLNCTNSDLLTMLVANGLRALG